MDLTQRAHGRLLAALSFNNRYPSPSSSSPSISSGSQLHSLFWPVLLSLFFVSHAPSIFQIPFQTSVPDFSCVRSFPLPLQPGIHTLSQCLPPPLFISPSLHPIRSKRLYKAQPLLPKRQWPTHKWPAHSCLISCYSNKEREEHQMAPQKFRERFEHKGRSGQSGISLVLLSPVKVRCRSWNPANQRCFYRSVVQKLDGKLWEKF